MDADIYLSPYGKSRTSKAKKIKTFAIHKPFHESSRFDDPRVIVANDTNEISVSFDGRSDSKVFSFDKVLCDDESQMMLYNSLLKSIVQDVVMGLNSFLILCNLSSPTKICAIDTKSDFPGMQSANSLLKNILKELLSYASSGENIDSSLHASYFEVHDDRILDLLNKNNETDDLKILNVFQQKFMEIKDLTGKPIVNETDIADILTKQSHGLICYSSICHSIFAVSLVKKNESCSEFESMKNGKLFVVDFAKCKNNVIGANIFADCDLKIPQDIEFATSSKNQLCDILKPAFGGSARTIILVSLSSYLYSPERDLSILQFIAPLQNVYNYPDVDIKMIIPTSLIEYSEEIQELQKDLSAMNQKTGVKVEPALYRCFKNSTTAEEEKLKIFSSYLLLLKDSNNSKKQNLISIHSTSEQTESKIKGEEKCFETLKQELKNLQEQNDVKQKSSACAYEIIKMKQMRNVHDFNLNKLKSTLNEVESNYYEITNNLKSLNSDIASIASDIESERSFLKKTFVSLVNDMQSVLSELQTQHEDLMSRLNSLSNIDGLFNSWKIDTESMLTDVSNFTKDQRKNFDPSNFKVLSSVMPLQTLKPGVVKIIEKNKIENSPILFCFVHKIKVLSDSLLKTLSEILHILDSLQINYKTELMSMGSIISSSIKTFKKFFDDIGCVLKMSQQYNEQLGSEAKEISDLVFFHHKFKKNFDGQLNDIKHSILKLKQSCLNHNDVAISKWNEVRKNSLKTSKMHSDISENLSLIKKQMSLHLNQALQKLTLFNYLQLKEEAQSAQTKILQLLEVQDEMNQIFASAVDLENKGMEKEVEKVKEYTDLQKLEVDKCFSNYYLKMRTDFNSFVNDLQTVLGVFRTNEEEMKNNFCHLSSMVSSLTAFYDNYLAITNNIYGKSEKALKLPPVINVVVDIKEDNLSGMESIYIDDWNVVSSTPKVAEVRQMDIEFEKEKMLGRIRSIVEQQTSKKSSHVDLEYEGKEETNISTMSLPNISRNRSIYAKGSQTSENVYKTKSSRKRY